MPADEPPSVEEQVATLQAYADKITAEAMTKVGETGELPLFDAGMKMGILIGVGLATAHRIKEGALRDKYRAQGSEFFYQHHDRRAVAFGEMANALTRWIIRLDSQRESSVPDSVSGSTSI